MALIEIGHRNYLLYLLLPHPLKVGLLSSWSRLRLDTINRANNETIYSGEAATSYDTRHRYGAAEQHDFPLRELIEQAWAGDGYGHALEVGAGTGYATALIARRAQSVVALELVPDMQAMIRARCAGAGLGNVQVVGGSIFDIDDRLTAGGFDTAFVIQSLHHFHRRPDVFAILRRTLRPGGRLFLLEPHHNVRRVARLLRAYLAEYRAPAFRSDERNWATHDFLTRRELHTLCRRGGFEDVRITGHWIPFARRILPDRRRRFDMERVVGSVPGLRHAAAVLAVEARRDQGRSN
jgi:SAM-dependent methyltransferase